MEKSILVVVDMQNDFIDGALGSAEAQNIVPCVAKRILSAKQNGEEIVYTRDTHGENYLSTQEGKKLPVLHCIKNSHGWQIADSIPVEGKIFDKPTFGSTELADYVKDGGFIKAELIGLCSDICVISNAFLLKSFCPELNISVRSNCCAGVTPQSHQNALNAMKNCQITVL